jgi:hypothetical protein
MENKQGYADPAKDALTDSLVSESVSIEELNPLTTTVPVIAPVPDQTALMMQMMQTMQAMQQQINEMRGATAPAPKTKATPKVKTAPKTKTVARA